MSKEIQKLSVEDFAIFLGATTQDMPAIVKDIIAKADFKYEILQSEQREQVILQVLKDIEFKNFSKVDSPERKNIWEMAWSDHLNEFVAQNMAEKELEPTFMRQNEIVRLNKNYVKPHTPNFELNYAKVCKTWLFQKYLGEVEAIYEFGCGSGFNLVMLSEIYAHKKMYGLDWASSSVNLVNINAEKHGLNIKGRQFNMLEPNEDLETEENSAFLTIAALEQVGKNYHKFVDFILRRKPKVVINLEPIAEYYDCDNLVDYLGFTYHKKRGYLDGYLSKLRELESQNTIKIIKAEGSRLGGLYHDAYSIVVWTPLP